jgi:hypothetical protein
VVRLKGVRLLGKLTHRDEGDEVDGKNAEMLKVDMLKIRGE